MGNSALIISVSDVGLLLERIQQPDIIGAGECFLRLLDELIVVHNSTGKQQVQLSDPDLSTFNQWTQRRISL